MKCQGIKRVCCLLPDNQLTHYEDLLGTPTGIRDKSCLLSPIEDFHFCDTETLTKKILPFLVEADKQGQKKLLYTALASDELVMYRTVDGRGLSN